ncbi:hypothetical protein HYW46_03045 [Candidatus Daviesbacteria bacterium]|nr:hypothetical protein [Candidatus Daviesbacteria bacterium]
MEDFARLEVSQARLLLKIIESDKGWATADGKNEGGTARALIKKGWIIPFGKIDRRTRWKIAKPFSEREINYLKDLINTADGECVICKSGDIVKIYRYNILNVCYSHFIAFEFGALTGNLNISEQEFEKSFEFMKEKIKKLRSK